MELDSRGRVHLEWMFENQPALVRELSQNGKLDSHLEGKLQQALNLVVRLKKERGLNEDLKAKHAYFETMAARLEALELRKNQPIQTAEKTFGD